MPVPFVQPGRLTFGKLQDTFERQTVKEMSEVLNSVEDLDKKGKTKEAVKLLRKKGLVGLEVRIYF